MIKRFRKLKLARMVTTVPVKLFKTPDETLMERVEGAKRQRINEVLELSAARTCAALEEDAERTAFYGRLELNLQQDIAERSKTYRQKQLEHLEAGKRAAAVERNRGNIAARKFLTPALNGAECFVITDANRALDFQRSFEARGFR